MLCWLFLFSVYLQYSKKMRDNRKEGRDRMGLKLKDWERQGEKTTTIKRDAVQIKAETELFAKKENGKKRVKWGKSVVRVNGSPHMDGAGTGTHHFSLSFSLYRDDI